MARYGIVNLEKLEAIGNALREKIGDENVYTLDEMPDAIRRAKGEPTDALMGVKMVVYERERIILTDFTLL